MKRLLLAPLLLAISGCSSDIVIKTDLGEKYIVKNSAVTILPYTHRDLINKIKKDARDNKSRYRNCEFKFKGKKRRGDYLTICEREYGFYNGISAKENGDLVNIENMEKYGGLVYEEDKVYWYDIRFRPIFVDLNKKKISKNYELISCLRPRDYFSSVLGDKYFGIKNRQPKEMTGLAFESMKAKVCKKYAKFK